MTCEFWATPPFGGVSGRAHEGPCRVARKLEGRSGINHLIELREETGKRGYQHQTPGNAGTWTMDDTPSVWLRGRHSGRSDQQQPTLEVASEGAMNRGLGKQTSVEVLAPLRQSEEGEGAASNWTEVSVWGRLPLCFVLFHLQHERLEYWHTVTENKTSWRYCRPAYSKHSILCMANY